MLTLNEKIHLNKNGSFTNYINNSRGQHLVNIMHFCVCVCEVFLSWLKSKNIYKRNKKIPSTLLTCIHLATKYNEMNLKEWGNRELYFYIWYILQLDSSCHTGQTFMYYYWWDYDPLDWKWDGPSTKFVANNGSEHTNTEYHMTENLNFDVWNIAWFSLTKCDKQKKLNNCRWLYTENFCCKKKKNLDFEIADWRKTRIHIKKNSLNRYLTLTALSLEI